MTPTIVLVGAGHAHLHVVSHARAFATRGLRLVLVDPGIFWYSGLATGMLSGQYDPADDQINVAELACRCGAEFVPGKVSKVSREHRRVVLESGQELAYDLLSLNVGSQVPPMDIPDDGTVRAFRVKPISQLADLRREITERVAETGEMPAVGVVGGGATGSEVASNLLGFAERRGIAPRVALVTPGPLLAPDFPTGASVALTSLLEERGLKLYAGQRVTALRGGEMVTEKTGFPCDIAVFATGLTANPLVQRLGVQASAEGVAVEASLESVSDPRVFAVGDCADFVPRRLPNLGVFGVRAAPVLRHNLFCLATEEPRKVYRPQKIWMSILNLGNGQGLLRWGRFWWLGKLSLRLKEHLDQGFLRGYQ